MNLIMKNTKKAANLPQSKSSAEFILVSTISIPIFAMTWELTDSVTIIHRCTQMFGEPGEIFESG